MSQAELLSLIGTLFGLFCVLIAVIYSIMRRDIAKLEKWTVEKEQFDRQWRHNEYAPKIAAINALLLPSLEKVSNHERRINKLDAKVFNGSNHDR